MSQVPDSVIAKNAKKTIPMLCDMIDGWKLKSDGQEVENAKLRADNKALRDALLNLCDSLRKREGSNLIRVNHDELMEFIPAARKALAEHSEPQ